MNSRDQLISVLVDDLQVKKTKGSLLGSAMVWWLLSWFYIIAVIFLSGPVRAVNQWDVIVHSHQFQIESLVGLIASLLVTIIAWYGSTPGALTKRLIYLTVVFVAVWLGFYLVGFFEPALEPSMHGKREHCYLDVFIYSLPPTIIASICIARRYPIKKVSTGFALGLASGMMPALFMQFACMYEAKHIFTHHILPTPFAGLIGIFVLLMIDRIKKEKSKEAGTYL